MADLDAASKDHPILVYYTNMHTATGNGLAFARASIPANIGDLPGGGRFGRGPAGKLDGMIYEESALKKFAVAIPKITPELAGKAVIDWLKINASVGNTLVHEAGALVFGDLLEGYERIVANSPCRASISLMYDSMKDAEPYKQYGHGAQATTILGTTLTIYAMKIVGDGQTKPKARPRRSPISMARTGADPILTPGNLRRWSAKSGRRAGRCRSTATATRRSISLSTLSRASTAPSPRPASTGLSIARSPAKSRSSGWRGSASSRAFS
jgi:predicted amidohydrolase YtcJ